MRSRKNRIIALLLALTMLAGDASLAYAAEEPETEAVIEEETVQEQTEPEEAEESAGVEEQEESVGGQAGQEAADSDADEGAETELAAPQTEEAADTAGEAETAESVQMADAVSGEYTYTTSGVNATITGYTGSEASLVIPEELDGYTVQGIGDSAFAGNLTLTSVEIPASVETIGSLAFDNCVNLKTVTLYNGLVTVGQEFMRGTGVTEITLPRLSLIHI